MRFHEHARDTSCNRRAREHRNELALATATRSLSARQLNRVRCVEHDGATRRTHDGERAHVRHQVVVAEGRAALAYENVVATARLARLGNDVHHVFGSEELTLLDVDGLSRRGDGADEVRLAAEKRRRLQDVDDGGDFRNFFFGVHVRKHRHSHLTLYFRQDAQTLLHPEPAKRLR